MPTWWPFKKDAPQSNLRQHEDQAYQAALNALRQQVGSQLLGGQSKQAILKALLAQAEALETGAASPEAKGQLRAYDQLHAELRSELLQNLQMGRALEMAGRVDEAIGFYETAVADQMSTRFPYEHLRVIYWRRESYADTLRICKAAVANPFLSSSDHAYFQGWADRLEAYLQAQT